MTNSRRIHFLPMILLLGGIQVSSFRPPEISRNVMNKSIYSTVIHGRPRPSSLLSFKDSLAELLQGGSFDQFVQGALNSATGTEEKIVEAVPSVIEKASEVKAGLNLLGTDLLAFLCATIFIVPLFKFLKESPVIGFLSKTLNILSAASYYCCLNILICVYISRRPFDGACRV